MVNVGTLKKCRTHRRNALQIVAHPRALFAHAGALVAMPMAKQTAAMPAKMAGLIGG